MNDTNSLSHTKWNCKYHIVFAPKYRRKVFYGERRREIGDILRTLCEWKKVRIVEAEVCPDHVHMLLEIPPAKFRKKLAKISRFFADSGNFSYDLFKQNILFLVESLKSLSYS